MCHASVARGSRSMTGTALPRITRSSTMEAIVGDLGSTLLAIGLAVLGCVIMMFAVRRLRSAVDSVADAAPPTVSSSDACDFYVKAGKVMVKGRPEIDPILANGTHDVSSALDEQAYPLAAKQAWLRQDAAALTLLRQGLQRPYLEPWDSANQPASGQVSRAGADPDRGESRQIATEDEAAISPVHWTPCTSAMRWRAAVYSLPH